MELARLILEVIGLVAALIPTIISVVCLIKNIIKNKNWELVKNITLSAMSSVEEWAKTHPEMSSEDKLNMALEAIKSGLAAADIEFNEQLVKQIIAYIEEMCKWSKAVNADCK